LIAVWYFNNMGTYVNADVGHSNEQVATYGFTPWQDTYIPAIAPTRSFRMITDPTFKTSLLLNFCLVYFREVKELSKRHAKSLGYFIQGC
ncbi:hypothetical protein SAMN04489725_1397, partial [Alicyclobacillus hesperidum]